MAEPGRPGIPQVDDTPDNVHVSVTPAGVFYQEIGIQNNALIDNHAQSVAGVMISNHSTEEGPAATGVAPDASLFASALGDMASESIVALSLQNIAVQNDGNVWAINISFSRTVSEPSNGRSHLSRFVDWSSRIHDTLYVVAGHQGDGSGISPQDHYNGITVASSAIEIDVIYRRVHESNDFSRDAEGPRTTIDLVAPGEDILLTRINNTEQRDSGTSVAAPHVTGTIALLQEYAKAQIDSGAPRWDADARNHQVMKAVLMNSADKIEDTGNGFRLGMTRTLLDTNGDTWLDSTAYTDPTQPLDIEMGAGHLNAARAFQQFAPGEFDRGTPLGDVVPQIGWDDGNTLQTNRVYNVYEFAEPLPANSFVSITLAWDRIVNLDTDNGTMGAYDIGDTFIEAGDFNEGFNDLDIHLMPAGAADLNDSIARSFSGDSNLEHLFFQIPAAGMYEFWVYEANSPISLGTDYAVAWWAYENPNNPTSMGDYNGDLIVDESDYLEWKNFYGEPVVPGTGPDGNGDGIVDARDYVVWRNNLGTAGALATAVPEPALGLIGLIGCALWLAKQTTRRKSGMSSFP